MTTSLVLPCYNPPEGWAQNVCATYRLFCAAIGSQAELIIVIDGATIDEATKTYMHANIAGLKWIAYAENKGKGYAIRQGVAAATGDLILYTDIDFPYTDESIQRIYRGLRDNEYDVGVGVKDEAYYAHVPFLRKTISKLLKLMIRIFLSMPVTDTQCGLKGFRRNVVPVFLSTTINRYLFDLEFIRYCFRNKALRVKAVPVTLREQVQFRHMNYSMLIPEVANFIKILFRGS